MLKLELKKGHKRAILFGATGLVGKHCLEMLIAHDAYDKVVCFTRRPIKHRNEKVDNVVLDFKHLDQYSDQIKGDDLYLCLGTTLNKAKSQRAFYEVEFNYCYKISSFAKQNGVSQILLVSIIGADPASFLFNLRVKGELEKTIQHLEFWGTHIFRPSLLVGEREEPRFKAEIAAILGKGINILTRGGLENLTPIEAKIVAQAMITTAQQFKKGINYYESFQLKSIV